MTWMNSKAVELEATVTSTTRQFLGAGRKEEVLNQAAITHLQVNPLSIPPLPSSIPQNLFFPHPPTCHLPVMD